MAAEQAAPAWQASASAAFKETPPPAGTKYAYGTAGFRMEAGLLDAVCLRMGVLAALRAQVTGKVCRPGALATGAEHAPTTPLRRPWA